MRQALAAPKLTLGADWIAGSRVLIALLLFEAERAGDHHVGEGFDLRVQVANRGVVIAPRALEMLLDLRQFFLKLAEIRVGLEVRIGLGNGHQPAEHPGEGGVRLRRGGDAAAEAASARCAVT